MYDITASAAAIARWTGLGVTLPSDLSEAITTFETVQWAEVGHHPAIDLTDIDPSNVEERLREFAEQLALSDSASGGQSVLQKAKSEALSSAARAVVVNARFAVDDVIEQLTDEFDEHAEAYTAAVSVLPDVLTAEALVAEGASAVTAYAQAQAEAQYIDRISLWIFSTAPVVGVAEREAELTLRVLRPATPEQLTELDAAAHGQHDPTLAAIGATYFTAARLGVPFGLNSLTEAAELRGRLS